MMRFAILALALLPSMARGADLTPEDYNAALIEANSQISGLSNRAQQLAITVAQQGREIAKLKADAMKPPDMAKPPQPKP